MTRSGVSVRAKGGMLILSTDDERYTYVRSDS